MTRVLFWFFFSSRRRHTRCSRDWSSDVCSSDLSRCAALRRPGGRVPQDGALPLRFLFGRGRRRHQPAAGERFEEAPRRHASSRGPTPLFRVAGHPCVFEPKSGSRTGRSARPAAARARGVLPRGWAGASKFLPRAEGSRFFLQEPPNCGDVASLLRVPPLLGPRRPCALAVTTSGTQRCTGVATVWATPRLFARLILRNRGVRTFWDAATSRTGRDTEPKRRRQARRLARIS